MDSNRWLATLGAAAVMALAVPAVAEEATAEMHAVSADGIGDQIGTIELADGAGGLVLETDLSGLPPGQHGFHLHGEGSCEPADNAEGQMTAALGGGRPLRSRRHRQARGARGGWPHGRSAGARGGGRRHRPGDAHGAAPHAWPTRAGARS